MMIFENDNNSDNKSDNNSDNGDYNYNNNISDNNENNNDDDDDSDDDSDDGDNDNDNNDDDVGDNDNENNADKFSVESPHKGPTMLSFDVTFFECKNNSRVFGDWRRHFPHVRSLWCDIFTQHCVVAFNWLVGDWFTTAEVFQVTQITRLNFNWGMLCVSSYL